VLNDGGITIPSESGSSSSALDYSAQIAVVQQLLGDIPVPNSQTTTVTLLEFINYQLVAYDHTTNWELHLAYISVLPFQDYETFT
jgi:hypothetical protein